MLTVDQDIANMRDALGVKSDSRLAEFLGYTRGAITQWRNRGAISDAAVDRFKSYVRLGECATRMDDRRRELGQQMMYEGRCLALFLAPSIDAARHRFPVTAYTAALRLYTSLFDEIELARLREWSVYDDQITVRIVDASRIAASNGNFRSISLGAVECKDGAHFD